MSTVSEEVQILEKHGMGAKVGPAGALTAGRISSLSAEGVRLVCLSYFDADLSTAGARFAVRRLRRRLGEVKILAGFWLRDPGQANELGAATKADFCATRFKEVLAFCLREAVEEATARRARTARAPAIETCIFCLTWAPFGPAGPRHFVIPAFPPRRARRPHLESLAASLVHRWSSGLHF